MSTSDDSWGWSGILAVGAFCVLLIALITAGREPEFDDFKPKEAESASPAPAVWIGPTGFTIADLDDRLSALEPDRPLLVGGTRRLRQRLEGDESRALYQMLLSFSDPEFEAPLAPFLLRSGTVDPDAFLAALEKLTSSLETEIRCLVRGLRDTDPLARWIALCGLDESASLPQQAIAPLIELALNEELDQLRSDAQRALQRGGTPAVEQVLARLNEGGVGQVERHHAGRLLVSIRGGEADAPGLLALLVDPDPRIRLHAQAKRALLGQSSAADLALLYDHLRSDDLERVGLSALALSAIAELPDDVVESLIETTSHPTRIRRICAGVALAHLADRCQSPLIQALASTNAHTRLWCARALGHLTTASRAALSALRAMPTEGDEEMIQQSALDASRERVRGADASFTRLEVLGIARIRDWALGEIATRPAPPATIIEIEETDHREG